MQGKEGISVTFYMVCWLLLFGNLMLPVTLEKCI
jgi:hypothetical protein